MSRLPPAFGQHPAYDKGGEYVLAVRGISRRSPVNRRIGDLRSTQRSAEHAGGGYTDTYIALLQSAGVKRS